MDETKSIEQLRQLLGYSASVHIDSTDDVSALSVRRHNSIAVVETSVSTPRPTDLIDEQYAEQFRAVIILPQYLYLLLLVSSNCSYIFYFFYHL